MEGRKAEDGDWEKGHRGQRPVAHRHGGQEGRGLGPWTWVGGCGAEAGRGQWEGNVLKREGKYTQKD